MYSENINIKLIALDLDGTTLDGRGRLSRETKEAIERAAGEGIHVVIATGRTLTSVPAEIRNLKGIKYLITSNGAVTADNASGEILQADYVSETTVNMLSEMLKDSDIMIEVCTEGRAYTEASCYNAAKEGTLGFRNREYILATRTPVDDIYAFMKEKRKIIENINLNFKNPEERKIKWKELVEIENCTVTSSFDYNIEIGGIKTSKANALKSLCGKIGILPDDVMSFGDSLNDLEMLSFSGYPVAMGNACGEVKEKASIVCETNDENGVARIVNKYILKKL